MTASIFRVYNGKVFIREVEDKFATGRIQFMVMVVYGIDIINRFIVWYSRRPGVIGYQGSRDPI